MFLLLNETFLMYQSKGQPLKKNKKKKHTWPILALMWHKLNRGLAQQTIHKLPWTCNYSPITPDSCKGTNKLKVKGCQVTKELLHSELSHPGFCGAPVQIPGYAPPRRTFPQPSDQWKEKEKEEGAVSDHMKIIGYCKVILLFPLQYIAWSYHLIFV